MQRIEVSHKIEMGMKTYPGFPEPQAEVLLDYDSGRYGGLSKFYIASLNCCGKPGLMWMRRFNGIVGPQTWRGGQWWFARSGRGTGGPMLTLGRTRISPKKLARH
jgi:hypothetical protein